MPAPAIDHGGQRFGRLIVIGRAGSAGGVATWNCLCDCGKGKTIRGSSLRRGFTRSCGCLIKVTRYAPEKKYATEEDAAWGYRYDQYRRNAKFRKIPFELSLGEFKTLCALPCRYCGTLPEKRPPQRNRALIIASGIDRVKNEGGYVMGNVVPCCTWCNQAKNSHSVEDFLSHCRRIAEATAIARNE